MSYNASAWVNYVNATLKAELTV